MSEELFRGLDEDELEEVIETNILYYLAALRTSTPAEVVAVDGNRLTVQPLIIKKLLEEGRYSEQTSIPGVRGIHLGTETCRVSMPIDAGTQGLLMFADRDIQAWLAGDGSKARAQESRKHDYKDAMFLPGLKPFMDKEVSLEDLTIEMNYRSDDPSRVTLKASGDIEMYTPENVNIEAGKKVTVLAAAIEMGKESLEAVLKGDSFRTYFMSHTHPTGVGPSGGVIQPWGEALLSKLTKTE